MRLIVYGYMHTTGLLTFVSCSRFVKHNRDIWVRDPASMVSDLGSSDGTGLSQERVVRRAVVVAYKRLVDAINFVRTVIAFYPRTVLTGVRSDGAASMVSDLGSSDGTGLSWKRAAQHVVSGLSLQRNRLRLTAALVFTCNAISSYSRTVLTGGEMFLVVNNLKKNRKMTFSVMRLFRKIGGRRLALRDMRSRIGLKVKDGNMKSVYLPIGTLVEEILFLIASVEYEERQFFLASLSELFHIDDVEERKGYALAILSDLRSLFGYDDFNNDGNPLHDVEERKDYALAIPSDPRSLHAYHDVNNDGNPYIGMFIGLTKEDLIMKGLTNDEICLFNEIKNEFCDESRLLVA